MSTSSPPVELDINALYRKTAVNLHKKPEEAPICFEIDGTPAATYGNFSVITGKAKSKKTFFVSLLVANILSEDSRDSFITCPTKISDIVFIDTEQSKFDVYGVAQRMITKPEDKKRLKVYSLRSINRTDRIKLIKDIIHNIKAHSLIIIDGLRDLVTSINDEDQATIINDLLLQATENNDIHIIGVIHQNKRDNNARGHLGTELINKAETVFSVTARSSNTSKVEASYCRREAFPDFKFSINDEGLPYIVDYLIKTKKGRIKKLPNETDEETHNKILMSIKKSIGNSKPKYKELLHHIKEGVEKNIESIGISKTKEYLKFYENDKKIVQKGIKHTPDSYYDIVI
ncbi:MAG: AAA family ATPase [Balneola sp.]